MKLEFKAKTGREKGIDRVDTINKFNLLKKSPS